MKTDRAHFWHQAANAAVAMSVGCAALANEHYAVIWVVCAWCSIDFFVILARSPEGAKKQALLVHHALTAAQGALFRYDGHLLERRKLLRLARYFCLLEISTVFVCLYNCFPTAKFLKVARDVAFVGIRGAFGGLIMWEQMLIGHSLRTRDVACQVAMIALSAAWMGGNTHAGRSASLLLYYVSFVTAYGRSAKHVVFVVLSATGGYFFYEHGVTSMDRGAASAHALYSFVAYADEERWVYFCAACAVAYALHRGGPERFGRAVNDAAGPLLAVCILKGAYSPELVAALAATASYLIAGGPEKLSYGHRILWHAACNCVTSEIIRRTART